MWLTRTLGAVIFSCISVMANACTCWHPEPKEYLSAAGLIFRGTVTSVGDSGTAGPIGVGAGSVTIRGRQTGMRARFAIQTVYKGKDIQEVEIGFTASDGANCGWRFKPGEEVTVFASGSVEQGYFTGMCLMIPYAAYTSGSDLKYKNAIEVYRQKKILLTEAAQKSPESISAWLDLATFFVGYSDYPEASEAYSKAIALAPLDTVSIMGRAETYYRRALYEDALTDYRLALNLNPTLTQAKRGKTFSLVSLGRQHELESDDRDFSGYQSDYSHNLSFTGTDLRGASFRNAKLSNIDFSKARLDGADFSGASLHKCNFSGATLARARFHQIKGGYGNNFTEADFSGANLSKSDLIGSNFTKAVLDNADLTDSNLEDAILDDASLVNTKLKGSRLLGVSVRNRVFVSQNLTGVDLRNADLRNTIFRMTALDEAKIGFVWSTLADLRDADLAGAKLDKVQWSPFLANCRTKLPRNTNLSTLPALMLWSDCPGTPPNTALNGGFEFQRGPRISKIEARNSPLQNRDLSGFGFWNVNFDGSDFSRAILRAIDIQGGSYNNVNFSAATMVKAHISRVSFANASFQNADLSEARLSAVDLSGANLEGATLNGLCFDFRTKWPDGFDQSSSGAKYCP